MMMTKRNAYLLLVTTALALLASAATGTFATPTDAAQRLCKPRLVGKVLYACGPATARLSVFPGVTFKNGSCHRIFRSSPTGLSVGIGVNALRLNTATNDGRPLFGLTISGPLSHPTGGGVLAYWKSKSWRGRGVSFKGTANGGTFVARGIQGSRGTATGSFHC